jgi:hypothetical protein
MHIDMCLLQTCSLSYESHQFHLVVHHLRYLVLLWSPSSCLYIVGSIFICEGCLSRNMSMLSRRDVSDIAAWLYIRCLVFAYVVCVAHHEKAKRHEPPCSSCCSFLYARIYMIFSLDMAPYFRFFAEPPSAKSGGHVFMMSIWKKIGSVSGRTPARYVHNTGCICSFLTELSRDQAYSFVHVLPAFSCVC